MFPPISTNPEERLPPLRRLDLRGVTPDTLFCDELPTSIEYLRLQGGPARHTAIDPPEKTLPNLHTLIFSDTGWVTDEILTLFLLDFQPPIRVLHLDQCFNVSWYNFLLIMENEARNPELVKLTELSIAHMREANDNNARVLHKTFLDLKVLDMSYTGITGCTIRMFADARASGSAGVSRLDRLLVRGCEGVSSDAVAYGREKGLEIVT